MTDDSLNQRSVGNGRETARFADYVAIARLDHATKHVFILPGIVLAVMLRGVRTDSPVQSIVFGLAAALLVASANYVINEWLDRDFDRHHPTKSQRSAVQRELRGRLVGMEWLALLVAGLSSAYAASTTMAWVDSVFALQGLAYNVPPVRTKDKPYLASFRNPSTILCGCWSAG